MNTNKYMGVMPKQPMLVGMGPATPSHHMMNQQHLAMMCKQSYISKAERKQNEKMAQLLEDKKQQERVQISKNLGELKKGIKTTGVASFKIVHLGSKMAGEEAKKLVEV